jgi:hypothetical protein
MPLWNEILEIPVPKLPASLVLRLHRCHGPDDVRTVATFDLLATDDLAHSFYDEWLSARSSPAVYSDVMADPGAHAQSSECDASSPRARPPRLHVACSLDRAYVEACRRGLRPSSPSRGPHVDLIRLATRTALPKRDPFSVDAEPPFSAACCLVPTMPSAHAAPLAVGLSPPLSSADEAAPTAAPPPREAPVGAVAKEARSPCGCRASPPGGATAAAEASAAVPQPVERRLSARWRQQQDQQASFSNLSETPCSSMPPARAPHFGSARTAPQGRRGDVAGVGGPPADGGGAEAGRAASPGGRSLSPLGRIMFHAADLPAVAEALVEGDEAGGAGERRGKGKGKLQSDF